MAVTDADVSACYNMSLKDFEQSGVHDLFKVSKFIYICVCVCVCVCVSSLVSNADICLIKF